MFVSVLSVSIQINEILDLSERIPILQGNFDTSHHFIKTSPPRTCLAFSSHMCNFIPILLE